MNQFKAFTVESKSDFQGQSNGHFLLLINPKSTGLFAPGTAMEGGGGVFHRPYVKLDRDILEF